MLYNIFFSPTGGTKAVADCLCNAICPDYVSIDLVRRDTSVNNFTCDDICVISAPAYGGRVPEVFAERLSALRGNGARAVLAAVFGNRAIDDTLAELYDIAEKCGLKTIAAVEAVAEHSLVRIYGKGRPDKADREDLARFGQQISDKLEHRLITAPVIPGTRPYKTYTPSPMELVLDRTCTGCRKCALECPVEAISLTDVRSYDHEKCFCCLRCVAVCPVGARHHSPEAISALEKRLSERCSGRKENRLYI